MSVPEDFTILDITGTFTMNKTLSDPTDEILTLQGVSWFKRKIIAVGTVTLYVKHYKTDNVENVDIDQTITGGIPGTREERILDWVSREKSDSLFGDVVARSRRVKLDEIEEEYLKKDWTADTVQHGVIQSYVESDTPKSKTSWIADQTWGIEVVNGERRYARHVNFTGPQGQDIKARLVYDYLGPIQ